MSVQALPLAFLSKDLYLFLRHNSVDSSVDRSLMVLQAQRSLELLIVYSHNMTENSVTVNRNKTLRHSAELEMQRKLLRETVDCSPKTSCPYFIWIYVLKWSKPLHTKGKERKEKYSGGRGNSTDGINTGKWHCSKTVIYVTILIAGFCWVHRPSHPGLHLCFATMAPESSNQKHNFPPKLHSTLLEQLMPYRTHYLIKCPLISTTLENTSSNTAGICQFIHSHTLLHTSFQKP